MSALASSMAPRVEPGQIAFAVTPVPARSAASARTYPTIAALAAEYAASRGMARSAAAEATATNRPVPASIIGGTHTSARCRTPYRLPRSMSSNASSGISHARSPRITPATAIAAPGERPDNVARSVSRTELSPVSATSESTSGAPASRHDSTTDARSAGSGIGYDTGGCGAQASTSTSDQPWQARPRAVSAPMPRAAPVTTARRSATTPPVPSRARPSAGPAARPPRRPTLRPGRRAPRSG